MKQGEKSIHGVFYYDRSVKYEYADFVIKGTGIYVCCPKTGTGYVVGSDPETDTENYYLYLSDKLATPEDYEEFLSSGASESKALSLGLVKAVLDRYMFGMTGNGIITEATGASALSELLYSDTINYAVLYVSREHPEIKDYLISDLTEGSNSTIENTPAGTAVILRQSTYYNENSEIVRVQELFDHIFGMIYSRTRVGDTCSEWEVISSSATSLNRKANELIHTYLARINELKETISGLKNNFRMRQVGGPDFGNIGTVDLRIGDNLNKSYTIPSTNILLSILTKVSEDGVLPKMSTITINLSDQSTPRYYITDDVALVLTWASDHVTLRYDVVGDVDPKISMIYYQQFYE